MNEQTDDSRPSNATEKNRNETSSLGGIVDSTDGACEGGWTFVTQAHYDPDGPRDLTTVIIRVIAEAEEVPITEIKSPPLYKVVDIAGIDDALFGRPEAHRDGAESTVEFRYNQYKVSVEADGWVTAFSRPLEAAAETE